MECSDASIRRRAQGSHGIDVKRNANIFQIITELRTLKLF